ncbi:uncharacterized protein TNCV_3036141 [Trichonephila clavipes]|nr:uncharacterized protein TNCV_3036141 [Trichonephila clavipes]
MRLQHDGVPAHIDVRTYLNVTFGARWLRSGEPAPWSPRSTDLTSLDYFLWGHLKNIIYAQLDSDKVLIARISEAVREIPGMFEQVHQSFHQR